MNTIAEIQHTQTNFIILGKSSYGKEFLSLHKVDDNGKVLAETPFTKDTAKSIASLFSDYKFKPLAFNGFIDPSILLAESTPLNTRLIFTLDANPKQKLFFKKGLRLKTDYYSIPTLVFYYHNKSLSVFATTDKKVTADSLLFIAPFFNVFNTARVCLGDIDLSCVSSFNTYDALKEYIINIFFQSVFTHSNDKTITADYLIEKKDLKHWSKKDLFPFIKDKTQLTVNHLNLI